MALLSIWRALLVLSVYSLTAKCDHPVDLEALGIKSDGTLEGYRLPEDLDPIHFDVEMTPYFEDEGEHEAFSFDGIVTMTFKALRSGINSFVIQENVRTIESITLTDLNGVPISINVMNPFERIREYHLLKVNLQDGVTLGDQQDYILKIEYIGNINETPLSRGVFRGSYVGDDGTTHWYAASHLQPTNSRQAFPSFDEPGYKSTFRIIINRPNHYNGTFSNMNIEQSIPMGADRTKEIYKVTPRMSAYLVTVHISEEFTDIADTGNAARPYRVIARPNAQGQGQLALEFGPPITSWLENYLSISYYGMDPDGDMKNDQIAVPDWASGATENWGFVSYRENRLLFEEGETSTIDKSSIAAIIAHELAHKWFGNLVTCKWWENVWINEGYATYFENFAVHGAFPELELEDQFNIVKLQGSLSTDSAASTRALTHTVNSPTEVTGHFTGISYSKGGSLLQMLKHLLTEETFRKGLTHFLVDRSYENATPDHVYEGFEKAVQEDNAMQNIDMSITEFMRPWVEEEGYPVLNVHVDMETGEMHLSQERFFISATSAPTDQLWTLPLTYTTGSNPNWENTQATYVMTAREDTLTKDATHEWVIFNVKQNAHYRVNYDTHNWEMIASALKNNPSSIHYLNRAQIVDDVFNLMRAERLSYVLGFQILDFLKDETNYYVWYPAITGFTWLRNRFLHIPHIAAEYDEMVLEFMDKVVNELGYNVQAGEPISTTMNRFYMLAFACTIGHEGCVNDALSKWNDLKNNGVSVDPDLRRHVFCTGVQEGGYDDWKVLVDRRAASNNAADVVVMHRAMGCTDNDQAMQEYLEMILTDDVKAQDRSNAFTYLFMSDRSHARRSLPFIEDHIDEIRTSLVLPSFFATFLSNLAGYMDAEGLDEWEAWLIRNQDSFPEYTTATAAVTSARRSMEIGTNISDIVLTALRGSVIKTLPSLGLIFSLVTLLIVK